MSQVGNLVQFDSKRYRRVGRHGHRTFWTKGADGGSFVTLRRGTGRAIEVEVIDPVTSAVQHFGSLRAFWRSLGKAAPVSIARYVGHGRGDGTLLEILGAVTGPTDRSVSTDPNPAGQGTGTGLGIDLAARGHEVRKLMWAGFGRKILRAGYDPEDVLQEVYRGLIARNAGICPWDGKKSSFGHYVHMVIGCVLINYHRKQQQVRGTEVLGARGADGQYGDAGMAAVAPQACTDGSALVDTLVGVLPVEVQEAGRLAALVLADGGSMREAQRASGLRGAAWDGVLAAFRGACSSGLVSA